VAREPCTAHSRGGQPCGDDAIPGGLVCLKHGGGAPQVAEAARRFLLLEARYLRYTEWEQSPTFARLCRYLEADRAFQAYERPLVELHLERGEDPPCRRCRAWWQQLLREVELQRRLLGER
jgi:hypothetical protein